MTLPYNQSGFKIEKNIIIFSHMVIDVPLSFDIGKLANGLKIKRLEIVNDEPYKVRVCLLFALLMLWILKILILIIEYIKLLI
jgi:hypothetical protein